MLWYNLFCGFSNLKIVWNLPCSVSYLLRLLFSAELYLHFFTLFLWKDCSFIKSLPILHWSWLSFLSQMLTNTFLSGPWLRFKFNDLTCSIDCYSILFFDTFILIQAKIFIINIKMINWLTKCLIQMNVQIWSTIKYKYRAMGFDYLYQQILYNYLAISNANQIRQGQTLVQH